MRRSLSLAIAALLLSGAAALAQSSASYRSAAPITPGTPVSSGDAVALGCSGAGTLRLVMHDGTFFDAYALQGTAVLDGFAVKDVNAAGTTATCAVTVLRR